MTAVCLGGRTKIHRGKEMFVQTHFQRARHQATGANSLSSSSTAVTGHHNNNHHHHHLLQSHSHSSASSQYDHNQHQREPSNHANHGHNQQRQHSEPPKQRARDAAADQRVQTIKGEHKQRVCDRPANADFIDQRADKIQKSTTHPYLRRESEFDERNENEIYHHHLHDRQQQMSSIKASNSTQTYTPPVGASSTTLRLRSASLSGLGSHQPARGDASGRETRESQSQLIQLRSQQARGGGFRSASLRPPTSRGRSSRDLLRLDRSRRSTSDRRKFELQLERILAKLIVGRSLTNKIFASERGQSSLDVHAPSLGAKYDKPERPKSHPILGALTAQLTRTLHCLVLFFVNFLQYHLQIARQILARTFFLNQFNNDSNDGEAAADSGVTTTMRAQRKQRPPLLARAGGAHSFDGARTMAAHPFAAPYLHNDYHQHCRQQQHQPVWMSPLVNEPAHYSVAGHVHRHNHTAYGVAGSSCLRLEELLPPHQVRAPFVDSPAIGRYRSLDCDVVHEPSNGPYANLMLHTVAPPASTSSSSYLASRQQQRNVPADRMWKWHNRHTVDGYPPGEEQVVGDYLPPMAGSFDQSQYTRHLGFPASAGTGAMPHRQHRLTSISSPTLSEYDNASVADDYRPEPAIDDARQQVPPTYAGRFTMAPNQPSQTMSGQTASTCGGPHPQVSNQHMPRAPGRRQLPLPPTHGVGAKQRLAHGHQSGGGGGGPQISNVRLLDRRLSSIMGSDSELYAAKRDGAQPAPSSGINYNSSDDAASVSSASRSRSRANANLMRFQLAKQAGNIQHHRHHPRSAQEQRQPASLSSPNKGIVDAAADRGRLARQASNAASAGGQRAGASSDRARARAHETTTPRLPHQFNSLQVDSPQHTTKTTTTTTTTSVRMARPNRRLTKSDTESKSPTASGDASKVVVGAQPGAAGTGSGNLPSRKSDGRPTSAKTATTVKSLAAGGKSKSVLGAHASPIGVLGKAVSLAGAKRRLGFKQKGGLNSLSVHRSEEYFPTPHRRARDPTGGGGGVSGSAATTASNSLNSDSCEAAEASGSSPSAGPRWLQFGHFGGASNSPDPRVCFVEGLGAGQIASRQALVSPYLGDIQVSLSDRRGMLEVEIIRVRQLQAKPGAKRLPSPYVKVYLMRNKKCAAKFKTRQLEQTLDPLYQQLFIFRDSDYSNCVLQIIVWADYGKKDRKSLMGIVQIHLNDLDMSQLVIGWYKLFNAPSMVAATASSPSVATSSKALRQTLSSTKLGDLATIQKQQQQQQQVANPLELPPVESKQQQQQVNNKS